jgi:hypothetical protein
MQNDFVSEKNYVFPSMFEGAVLICVFSLVMMGDGTACPRTLPVADGDGGLLSFVVPVAFRRTT